MHYELTTQRKSNTSGKLTIVLRYNTPSKLIMPPDTTKSSNKSCGSEYASDASKPCAPNISIVESKPSHAEYL